MTCLFQWQNKKAQFQHCRLLASELWWHDCVAELYARPLKQSEVKNKLDIN